MLINLFNMIFIVAVELTKENQVKKTKHGLHISNKNCMYFGINRIEQKGKIKNVLNLKYK